MPTSTSNTAKPSLQDFSLIRTYVEQFQRENALATPSLGFSYFVLDLLLGLQTDEIEDALTDSFYLQSRSRDSGHDRGIDAAYIDGSETPSVVHLFNLKYTDSFDKTDRFFPASEIDKILGFVDSLVSRDDTIKQHVNPALWAKVQEIWALFDTENPKFNIHICANHYHPFEHGEKTRFERQISNYTYFAVEYNLMPDLVELLTHKGKIAVNGKIKAIDKNIFEKSGGDIRALIVEVDARDLLRLVSNNEQLRDSADTADYSVLRGCGLLDDAFEDNVRTYLKQRTRINQNIKSTALGDENHRFFFYNNGITLTCSAFAYPRSQRAPIIDLRDLQIVNGSQTIHALYDAFQENPDKFENIEVLCRIYETKNKELSISIAEFTNSQNPVKSRDIRSNDYVQKKLERELLAMGYYYERKRSQHQDQAKAKRIDAEKAGQVLMSFFNDMPAEAKDDKRLIFADKYDEVFSDSVTAEAVLLAITLFDKVEHEKKRLLKEVSAEGYEQESFISHASYYLLWLLKKLAQLRSIRLALAEERNIFAGYSEALGMVRRSIEGEKKKLPNPEAYNHRVFFKGNRPKKYLDQLLEAESKWDTLEFK